MDTEYPVQKVHKSELAWLSSILGNHPQIILHDVPIIDTDKFLAVSATAFMDNDFKKAIEKNNIPEESSVRITLNRNNAQWQNWWDSIERVETLLSNHNIKNAIFCAGERDAPELIIDLAQDGLLTKLKRIYNEEVLPELAKKETTIIDPDGKERTAKDIVKKQISEQYQAMLERTKEVGIEEFELQKILKDAKAQFLAQQKVGKQ